MPQFTGEKWKSGDWPPAQRRCGDQRQLLLWGAPGKEVGWAASQAAGHRRGAVHVSAQDPKRGFAFSEETEPTYFVLKNPETYFSFCFCNGTYQ